MVFVAKKAFFTQLFHMDHLSAWVNTNQLLDRIGDENLKDLQDNIIQNVFCGFKNMLQMIINDHDNISYETHDKLQNILLTKQ